MKTINLAKVRWLDRTLIMGPHIALVTSEQQFCEALKKLGLNGLDHEWVCHRGSGATTHQFENENGNLVCIVSLSTDSSDTVAITALLAHEAVHIWKGYCENIGESEPSEELTAYAIQSITTTLATEAMNKIGKD